MFYHLFMSYTEDYEGLIKLQKLDKQIDTFKDEIKNLPEKKSKIRKEIGTLKKSLIEMEEELKKRELALREKNSEYKEEVEKLARYKKQLLGIKNNDEYRAMLTQIENQKTIITKLEDEVLKLEEELEEYKNTLPENKKRVEEEIKSKEKELEEAGNLEEVLENKISVLLKERENISGEIKVSYLRKYERLRKRGFKEVLVPIKKIVGIDGGEEYICTGCNSTIPLEISLKVKNGESFLRCENCGRFLYYEEEEVEIDG